MKTRPIGERFQDGGVTLEVKKEWRVCYGCHYGCYYVCRANRSLTGECGIYAREDGESVVFVMVEE
jgi:hypothetical protein